MSGGHWDYGQHQMESLLRDVARDSKVKQRFPLLARRIGVLAESLGQILHDLDWDFSDDCYIKDDTEFEREALEHLEESWEGWLGSDE